MWKLTLSRLGCVSCPGRASVYGSAGGLPGLAPPGLLSPLHSVLSGAVRCACHHAGGPRLAAVEFIFLAFNFQMFFFLYQFSASGSVFSVPRLWWGNWYLPAAFAYVPSGWWPRAEGSTAHTEQAGNDHTGGTQGCLRSVSFLPLEMCGNCVESKLTATGHYHGISIRAF